MNRIPALGQKVTYPNAMGETRPGKVVGIRHLPGYPHAVATVQTEIGHTFDIPAYILAWDAPPVLDAAELEILLDLVGVTESDMHDGSLSGTSWDLEDIAALAAKLRTLRGDR
jgi:hypothetical protein